MRRRSGSDAKRAERLERLDRIVERSRVGDDLLPVAVVWAQPLEPRVSAVDGRESVGLVDRDDAQPGEDRVALGLRCAGAIAHAVWQASSISSRGARTAREHGAVELAVMAAVQSSSSSRARRWGVGCRSGAA